MKTYLVEMSHTRHTNGTYTRSWKVKAVSRPEQIGEIVCDTKSRRAVVEADNEEAAIGSFLAQLYDLELDHI